MLLPVREDKLVRGRAIRLSWILFFAIFVALSAHTVTLLYRVTQVAKGPLTGTVHGQREYVPLRQQPRQDAQLTGFIRPGSTIRIESETEARSGTWVLVEASASLRGWIERELVELPEP
jgi:hypothetical protein